MENKQQHRVYIHLKIGHDVYHHFIHYITCLPSVLHSPGIPKSQSSPHTASGLGKMCKYETECKYSAIAHAVSSTDSC